MTRRSARLRCPRIQTRKSSRCPQKPRDFLSRVAWLIARRVAGVEMNCPQRPTCLLLALASVWPACTGCTQVWRATPGAAALGRQQRIRWGKEQGGGRFGLHSRDPWSSTPCSTCSYLQCLTSGREIAGLAGALPLGAERAGALHVRNQKCPTTCGLVLGKANRRSRQSEGKLG